MAQGKNTKIRPILKMRSNFSRFVNYGTFSVYFTTFLICEFRCDSFEEEWHKKNSTNMFKNNSSKVIVILTLITLSMLTWLMFTNKKFTNSLPLIQLTSKQQQQQRQQQQNATETDRCDNYYKKKEPRVLCTIFTTRASHSTRMKAIHDTWSKRSLLYLYL